MKIGVIAADEHRDRQKFISKPLILGGHDVSILKTKPFGTFLYNLMKLILKESPDVIVFMGVGPKELLALGFLKLSGMPFVLRLGGNRLRDLGSVAESLWNAGHYLTWMKSKADNLVAKFFLKKMSVVIVVNEALAIPISKQIKVPHRIYVIPQFCEGNGVTKEYDKKNPIELLTVTNFRYFEKAKGVIWLIEHLNRFVCDNRFDVCFRIAGDGLHLKDVKEYLGKITKSEFMTIKLEGFVEDLDAHYRNADILLYNSYHDATPNVILESKRYGLPLLANDCEEFRSIVEHGVTGLLYRNGTDFCSFLMRIFMEKEYREKIGGNALREHNSKFTIKAVQDKIEITFGDIINNTVERRWNR